MTSVIFLHPIEDTKVHLLHPRPDAVSRIAYACRMCYKSHDKSTPESDEKLIRMCIERDHTSVLEHESISFEITCSRAIMDELLRHRHLSASVESTRYCNYKDGSIKVYLEEPDEDLADAIAAYYGNHGYSAQVARDCLPLGVSCTAVVTANIAHWRHILKRRLSKAAHPHMRHLMQKVLNELMTEGYSTFFDDLNKKKEEE